MMTNKPPSKPYYKHCNQRPVAELHDQDIDIDIICLKQLRLQRDVLALELKKLTELNDLQIAMLQKESST